MSTPVLLDCDPGHDDAIALLLALASPELEILGVTTVAGNQTLDKTTANALKVLDLVGRGDVPVAAGAPGPLARDLFTAAYVHGESGLDGPELPLDEEPHQHEDGRGVADEFLEGRRRLEEAFDLPEVSADRCPQDLHADCLDVPERFAQRRRQALVARDRGVERGDVAAPQMILHLLGL